MSALRSPWDTLCPVMGSVEVNDFPLGLGMNRGHTGMCLCVFVVCQRGGGANFKKREVDSKKERKNKHDWKSAITVLEIMKWER